MTARQLFESDCHRQGCEDQNDRSVVEVLASYGDGISVDRGIRISHLIHTLAKYCQYEGKRRCNKREILDLHIF